MVLKVVWTKRAIGKLDNIISYLQKEWGENVTVAFIRRTYYVLDLLSQQPELGTIEHKKKNIRGFLLTKHNRLFYRTTEKEIIVLNLFDTRSSQKKI